MSGKKQVTWVFTGPEPYFAHCERCGECEQKPNLPAPIKAAVLYMRYVVERHRWCRAKEAKS